jgi:DNA uptake protein ComE-like DNA-binding protein
MEGGMTRKRGYLWLALILVGASLASLAAQPKGSNPSLPLVPSDSTLNSEFRISNFEINQPALKHLHNQAFKQYSDFRISNFKIQNYQYPKKALSFELNTADSLDLVQLYNIGPVIARRILKYRSLLGGYVRKEQLREVYGIDSARYNDIAPHLTVDPSRITPIDINTADIDRLKRHPYLDYYQAKAIIRLREERGAYAGVRDILNIPIIDSETFTRIEPYLICNSQPNK